MAVPLGGRTKRDVRLIYQDARLLKKGQLLRVKVFLQTLLPLLAAAAAAVPAMGLKLHRERGSSGEPCISFIVIYLFIHLHLHTFKFK